MKTEETIAHDIEWRWASHIQETDRHNEHKRRVEWMRWDNSSNGIWPMYFFVFWFFFWSKRDVRTHTYSSFTKIPTAK